jgi:hypothetical protein
MKLDPAQVAHAALGHSCEECSAEPGQPCLDRSNGYVHKARYRAGVHDLIAEAESTTSPVTVTGRAAGYVVGTTHPVDQEAFDSAQDGSVPWATAVSAYDCQPGHDWSELI